jgi:hypothetical protein
MPRPLDIEQLIRVPGLYAWDGLALSPDGQTAAVVWDKSGQWQIYLVPTAGRAALRHARLVAPGAESQMAPRCCRNPQGHGRAARGHSLP